MAYFKKTNIFKQVFFSRGMVVAILFLIVFSGFGLYSIVIKSMDASRQRQVSESELSDLNKKRSELSAKIELLKTPEGQAEALKEEYPVVSPGEKVVVITEDTSPDGGVVEQDASNHKKGFWEYLKNLFK